MLYAHDVSFSLMDQFDDIPAKYRLSSLNEASGFSSLLEVIECKIVCVKEGSA